MLKIEADHKVLDGITSLKAKILRFEDRLKDLVAELDAPIHPLLEWRKAELPTQIHVLKDAIRFQKEILADIVQKREQIIESNLHNPNTLAERR